MNSAAPPTDGEVAAVAAGYTNKVVARPTYQAILGVSDPEAEDALIAAEREEAQARMPPALVAAQNTPPPAQDAPDHAQEVPE